MARESAAARVARATKIVAALERAYPDAHCALDHNDPYQLLVATILSAQCTDARVNLVTPALFARFPGPAALADGTQEEIEELIRSTGFFRNKGKNLLAMAAALVERHEGRVPETMDELRALPGVGRKTANVILGNAFGRNDGITVDTHVGRISRLLRLTSATDPEKVERDLMALFPQPKWTLLSHLLISHGRAICIARRPHCAACPIAAECPSAKRTMRD
ncbi:MAG: endonuclease III [Gemmatimonadales bacterium]|jgi:endonuclease-3|nr:MAG: endonuclease III [Gemmatimonadales bacterium]